MTVEVKLVFANAAAAAAALAVLAGEGGAIADAVPAAAAAAKGKGRGRPAGKVAEESLGSVDADEVAADPDQKKASGPSVDEISARITELIAAGKKEDVMKLLSKVGGTKASTIPEGKRKYFMDEAAKLLEDTDLTS